MRRKTRSRSHAGQQRRETSAGASRCSTIGLRRIRLDRLLEALEALPGVIEAQPLPGEDEPEPEIRFGWSARSGRAAARIDARFLIHR
jgi:hypothetical protein